MHARAVGRSEGCNDNYHPDDDDNDNDDDNNDHDNNDGDDDDGDEGPGSRDEGFWSVSHLGGHKPNHRPERGDDFSVMMVQISWFW